MREPDCFPPHWDHERITAHALAEILENQRKLIELQEKNMSALTDLQTSVSKLSTDLSAFVTLNSGGATDAELIAMKTQVDAMVAVVNPPAPAPAA